MTGMKRIITFIVVMFLILVIYARACVPAQSLEGRDTYKGLPVYQYNAEDDTVSIDGVLYESVEEFPEKYVIGERFGYLWYYPHYRMKEGVIYGLDWLEGTEDPTEYIYANSPFYKKENGAPIQFGIYLKRVDTD